MTREQVDKAWLDVARDAGRQDREGEVLILRAEVARLRAALEAIKTIKSLEPIGGWGDPYAEMVVSAVGIAANALAGRTLEPKQ